MELSKEQTDAITRLNETGVVFEFGKITFRKSASRNLW
jgi:hypothetical protein